MRYTLNLSAYILLSLVILTLGTFSFADLEKTESKDILVKAQSFGMKLWNIESEWVAPRLF